VISVMLDCMGQVTRPVCPTVSDSSTAYVCFSLTQNILSLTQYNPYSLENVGRVSFDTREYGWGITYKSCQKHASLSVNKRPTNSSKIPMY
jgi:hypothetical protein